MRYHDFNIRIVGKSADGYDVLVDSPAGSESVRVPLDLDDLGEHIIEFGHNLRGASGARDADYDAPVTPSPSHIGARLHDALLSGRVRSMYDRSVGEILNDPDAGLRIKLHLDLKNADVRQLAQLPWELAYDASSRAYLALSRQTPIVRYIDVPRPLNTCRLDGTLKILVVMASPSGHTPLDLAKERALIQSTWAGDERVEVDFLEHPTKSSLLSTLVDKSYNVLHYMGHGAYDRNSGSGALVLESSTGDADMLDATTLGTWLRDAPRMRLVVLNACDTGKASMEQPFAGVANRLVMSGLPAVVAMQFPISDQAAIDFARAFYRRLAAGFPVDEAITQGRKAILAGTAGQLEWATPVLYMRSPDGRVFDLATQPDSPPQAPPQREAAPDADADAPSRPQQVPPTAAPAYDTTALVHSVFLAVAYNFVAVVSAHRFVNFPQDVALLGNWVIALAVTGVTIHAGYVLFRSARSAAPLPNTLLALTVAALGLHLCLFTGGSADVFFGPTALRDYTLTFSYAVGAVLGAVVLLVMQLRNKPVAFSLAGPMAILLIVFHVLTGARKWPEVLATPPPAADALPASAATVMASGSSFAFGNLLQVTVGACAIVVAAAYLFASLKFSDHRAQ